MNIAIKWIDQVLYFGKVIAEKMDTLEQLLKDHKYQLVNIFLKNCFTKNTSNKKEFTQLVEFLFNMCDINIPTNEKERYVQEAEVATNIFSENMTLTNENLLYVSEMFSRIRKLRRSLQKDVNVQKELRMKKELQNNEQLLNHLYTAQYELTAKKTKDEFNQQLRYIQSLDQEINMSLLTTKQKKRYEEMADLMQQMVEKFLTNEEIKRIKLYNQSAIKSFKQAAESFKENMAHYQSSFINLRLLCESYLCIYDEKYLMNTTMMYFNIVYSEILTNLGTDDMKFYLTELSIITPKKGLDEVN